MPRPRGPPTWRARRARRRSVWRGPRVSGRRRGRRSDPVVVVRLFFFSAGALPPGARLANPAPRGVRVRSSAHLTFPDVRPPRKKTYVRLDHLVAFYVTLSVSLCHISDISCPSTPRGRWGPLFPDHGDQRSNGRGRGAKVDPVKTGNAKRAPPSFSSFPFLRPN